MVGNYITASLISSKFEYGRTCSPTACIWAVFLVSVLQYRYFVRLVIKPSPPPTERARIFIKIWANWPQNPVLIISFFFFSKPLRIVFAPTFCRSNNSHQYQENHQQPTSRCISKQFAPSASPPPLLTLCPLARTWPSHQSFHQAVHHPLHPPFADRDPSLSTRPPASPTSTAQFRSGLPPCTRAPWSPAKFVPHLVQMLTPPKRTCLTLASTSLTSLRL